MNTNRLSHLALLVIMVFTVSLAVACTPAPTATFDLKATLDRYLNNLPNDWSSISPAALYDLVRTTHPLIVEVREEIEVAEAGYIAGSINIPIRSLMKNLDKLPSKDQAIVVTCGSGHRSSLAVAALQLLGYSNVKGLASGFAAWKAANLPVEKGAPPQPKGGTAPTVDKDLLSALDRYFSTLPEGWNMIAPAALNELLKKSQPFQLEVREMNEVNSSGHIAGATNIPIRTLIKNLDKLPTDKSALIVAECENGHRSAMAIVALNLLGYTNARSLAGGFTAWTKAGLPVSK